VIRGFVPDRSLTVTASMRRFAARTAGGGTSEALRARRRPWAYPGSLRRLRLLPARLWRLSHQSIIVENWHEEYRG